MLKKQYFDIINDIKKELLVLNSFCNAFLAGSSANNELIWDKEKLISDIEVGVVVKNFSDRNKIKKIAQVLSNKYKCDLELFLVTKKRLYLRSPKNITYRKHLPCLIMYDIFKSSKWLLQNKYKHILKYEKSEYLNIWEADRLLLNRLGESSDVILNWIKGNEDIKDKSILFRWLSKISFSIIDFFLIYDKKYFSGYKNKANLIYNYKQKYFLSEDFCIFIELCCNFRFGQEIIVKDKHKYIFHSNLKKILDVIFNESSHSFKSFMSEWLNSLDKKNEFLYRHQFFLKKWDFLFDSFFTFLNSKYILFKSLKTLKYQKSISMFIFGMILYQYKYINTEFNCLNKYWNDFCK